MMKRIEVGATATAVSCSQSVVKSRVLILTYHEITQDPRVMKQARALAAAGYDVHVYCDWPEGFPQRECLDSVEIHRFKCFLFSGGGRRILPKLGFLKEAKPEVQKRYIPFADSCDALRLLEKRFGYDLSIIDKYYYKRCSGAERRRRKRHYRWERLKLRLHTFINSNLRDVVSCTSVIKRRHGELFHTISLLFAANIERENISVRPDIIHAHDIYTLPAGVMLARRCGAKLIYDAHEYEPGRATKLPQEGGALAAALENDCFAYVDALVTVSDGIAELYAKRYHRAPIVISNVPELRRYSSGQQQPGSANLSVRRQIGLTAQTPLIVFTGAIQREHRGADKLLKALLYLPRYQLALMGQRHTGNDAWFLSLAHSLGVRQRVHLLPPVDARDVPQAIACCDVSVVPFQDVALNHRLAMPNKLFEAAFAEVPLCVSDLPEMRRFVEGLGIGRAMDQTDPASIAEAIRDVCQNRARYALTEEARRRLHQEYSWPAQKTKLQALYNTLLSRTRAIPATRPLVNSEVPHEVGSGQ